MKNKEEALALLKSVSDFMNKNSFDVDIVNKTKPKLINGFKSLLSIYKELSEEEFKKSYI